MNNQIPTDPTASDPHWTVMHPRNGDAEAIEEMNARMLLFHPALRDTVQENHELMHEAHRTVQRDFSVAELFRRTLNQPQST